MAFVVSEWDRRDDHFTTDLYLAEVSTGHVSRLTQAPADKRHPRWSPDGRSLAFLTDRDGHAQIHVLDTLGGPPHVVVALSRSVESFEWSPDGKEIAFLAVEPQPPAQPGSRKLPVVASEDIEYQRLWIVDIATGSIRQLRAGAKHVVQFAFSPKGDLLASLGQASPRWPDQVQRELYIVSRAGGEPRRVTTDGGEKKDPTWSPDGTEVAYLAAAEGNPLSVGPPKVHVVSAAGGTPRILAAAFEGYAQGLAWKGGRGLLFTAGVGVGQHLYRVALGGAAPQALTTGDGVYSAFTTDRDGRAVAATHESPSHPPEVWVATDVDQPFRVLTALNPQVAEWSLGKVETTRWKSSDGLEIEGLVVYPVDYVAGRRYPTILYVHGGPESANLRGFIANWDSLPQVYAGAGFVVFMPNFRGSSNYGGRFSLGGAGASSIAPEEGSFADSMTGLDHLIEGGIADAAHLAIKGWSYGGYFTSWAIGHTDRFKVAVEGAGDTNLVSYYGTAAINPGFDLLNEHPYDDPALWHKRSPLTYASKVRTPCLILQGEKDEIVPKGQSQEFHKALQHFGVPTELVIYPDQPHGLQVPSYQIDKMRRELEWIRKYIN
ncbi:MAG TPA: S9 family peptidase [Vicinamibacteria bacterium]|nr:S9 family peptidase [Vicinamibacteria bacterium]